MTLLSPKIPTSSTGIFYKEIINDEKKVVDKVFLIRYKDEIGRDKQKTIGTNTSFTDTFELLAMQFIDDGLYGEIPKSLEFYLDYEKMARDLRMDYTEFESNIIGRVSY